jgi:hypothetical protein
VALAAVDTGAKMELVTAMINKEIHSFGMPILLTATAKESKVGAFQVVSYFEIAAPSRKTIHENTRSITDGLLFRVASCDFVDRSGPSGNERKTKLRPFCLFRKRAIK